MLFPWMFCPLGSDLWFLDGSGVLLTSQNGLGWVGRDFKAHPGPWARTPPPAQGAPTPSSPALKPAQLCREVFEVERFELGFVCCLLGFVFFNRKPVNEINHF